MAGTPFDRAEPAEVTVQVRVLRGDAQGTCYCSRVLQERGRQSRPVSLAVKLMVGAFK